MSDRFTGEPGQEDAALSPELARLDRLLLAEGRRWRRVELSTEGLERHVRLLARSAEAPQRNEDVMLTNHTVPDMPPVPPVPPQGAQPRWRGPLALVATILLVALAASVFTYLSASHSGSGGDQRGALVTPTQAPRIAAIQPRDTHLPAPANAYLSDISFSSPHDGWAVGSIRIPDLAGQSFATAQGVLLHYHDGVWSAASEKFPGLSIESVSMVSADDGWAVGYVNDVLADQYSGTVLLRFTGDGVGSASGGHWNVVSAPALANAYLRTIRMLSPDFGYSTGVLDVVVGDGGKSIDQYTLAAVYQGGVWKTVRTPFPAFTSQLVMISASEGWAIMNQSLDSKVFHYLNGVWTPVATLPGLNESLSMGPSGDIWALNVKCFNCAAPQPRAYSLSGSTWKPAGALYPPQSSQGGFDAQSIFSGGPGGVWVAYVTQDATKPASQGAYTTALWEYVNGGWRLMTLPPLAGRLITLAGDNQGGLWVVTQSDVPFSTTVLYTPGDGWKVYGKS